VVISDITDSTSVRVLLGPEGAKASLAAALGSGTDPRFSGLGVRAVVPRTQGGGGEGLRQASLEEYAALRLLYGVAEGHDLVERCVR
jgi:hypothetical protein